jgi:hypothetical protein
VDSSSIELVGSEIDGISLTDGVLRVSFSCAYITKTMTGSVEQTRWRQAGEMIIEDAKLEGDLPVGPLVCSGGDVGENVYTYRDMIPLPLESRGRVHCDLSFNGVSDKLVAEGSTIRMEMRDTPRYIEHVRAS